VTSYSTESDYYPTTVPTTVTDTSYSTEIDYYPTTVTDTSYSTEIDYSTVDLSFTDTVTTVCGQSSIRNPC
jgi:hypothetical protein